VGALLKGSWDALLGVPAMWRKRRLIMASARRTPAEMTALYRRYRMTFAELLDVERR
jgi:predicted LPLAT superfamily acyltransferase